MNSKLKEYNDKRDFEQTSEPRGNIKNSKGGTLRYVVQYHEARAKHYDFRLEWNGTLLSWAVPKGPSFCPQDKRLAVKVEDHPVDYIDFEGVIPKGQYGGGSVMVWDSGIYLPLTDMNEALKNGDIKIVLNGERLKGSWKLIRTKDDQWFLMKGNDEFALAGEGISQFRTSVKTRRTIEDIAAVKNPFQRFEVQTALLTEKPYDGNDWLYEIKYDGYRIAAFIENGSVKLITRNHMDFTEKFPAVASSLKTLADGRAMILDGEMTVADEDGKTDFQALQNSIKAKKSNAFQYIVFDIVALDGADLRELPLIKRKEKLSAVMKNASGHINFSKFVIGKGTESFDAAKKLGLEGIIGKKIDSVYSGTRNGDWIKVKCYRRKEFVIGGFTANEKNQSLSAVLLGYYNERQQFIYIGKAGTGFTEKHKEELKHDFLSIQREKPLFENAPKHKTDEQQFWLEPKLVAEIQFAEITNDHVLRQASFKGLRTDKNPNDIVLEAAEYEK